MKRRDFVKNTAMLTLPMILKSCHWPDEKRSFDIQVHSDANTGHIIRDSASFEKSKSIDTEFLIVGGGIAGMTAAYQLRDKDFLLCELSETLGGSSSAVNFNGIDISQGAHYDLSYPRGYGEEVIEFLEQLKIVEYHAWSDSWSFKDQHHIVLHRRKNQCFDQGEFRKDVLKEGPMKEAFLKLMGTYSDKMHLPTRLIEKEYQKLDKRSFLDFLKNKISIDKSFKIGLDYHMKDDYGAGSSEVSALAGIHYFMCRPYYKEIVELFSPPEGNHYFINKMSSQIDDSSLLTGHLVKKIEATKRGFKAEIIDVKSQTIIPVSAKKVIYAGQKHALKYIYPDGYKLFEQNTTSPWMVINIITDNSLPTPAFWQNEMITSDSSFMGFVDSGAQNFPSKKIRSFSAYYCLPTESRKDLLNVAADKQKIVESTVAQLSRYFQQDISAHVKKVFIKVMGHAMPIPRPGYLFDDKNQYRTNKNIAYAGVDNSRLPLFYEAVDSGLEAVKVLA